MQFFNAVTILTLITAAAAAYTGPCTASACGATSQNCPGSQLCVPYPAFDPALREGCTCAQGLKKRGQGSFMKRREEQALEFN